MTTTETLTKDQASRKSYTTLWVMIILFAMPYFAAMYFYMNQEKLDLQQSNYGTIISPVRPVESITLKTIDDVDFNLTDLQGKWILVTVGSSLCEEECQQNIYKIRQIRKAVAQDRSRVERLFLLTDDKDIDGFRIKMKDYEGMYLIQKSDNEQYEKFMNNFLIPGQVLADGVYIIDPLGNYMMAYPEKADATKMLDDIRRLLKISQVG